MKIQELINTIHYWDSPLLSLKKWGQTLGTLMLHRTEGLTPISEETLGR
jgi:hypothetical protein